MTMGHTGGVDRGDGKCYEEVGMQLWGIGMRALGREGYKGVDRWLWDVRGRRGDQRSVHVVMGHRRAV